MSDHTAPSLPTLHIADLGPLVVRVDGVEAALPGPKLKEVFLRLALANGESVSFDTLISDLWPGRDRLRARRNLQQQVYNLRAALGQDRIELVGSSYRLRREGTERDSVVADDGYHAARRLAELDPTASRERVKEVLDRFRGPPLAEFASADWARADAAQLDQLHESLRILDYQLRLQEGDDSLIAELRVLTDQQSENERYWAFLMTALYRAGRQEEALRAFQSARRRLRDRFGLQPGPALVELERQILTQAPELMRGIEELPQGSLNSCQCWTQGLASPLVGRDREVARLRAAVDGGTDLVLISGESGIGKSRLARELATEAAQRSVFYGTCDRSLGRSFPPIADIVEHAEQHNPGLIDGLESRASVDALRRLTEVAPADETHSSRSALVAALAALLRAATADLPPMLIVDQLQDADPDTLDVLGRLVGPMSGVKVCVVGITQPAGLTADAPLARWLRALPNEVVVEDIALGPLTSEQVCELAAALTPNGDCVPGDNVPCNLDCDDLLARSGGNPLFLTHLLAETVGDETTPQLSRVAWRRIARRSKEAIALLRAAAIDGLRPQGWLMVELSGLDHDVAAAALAEVLQDGLLLPTTPDSEDEPGANDRYWFTHGLLQRSLLEEIGPALCQAQHRRAAELMVARREAGNAIASGAIAAQFLKAAPLAGRGPAIDWLVRSADSSVGDSAYDRAMAELRHALSLVSDSSEDDELAAELLTQLGTITSTYVHEGDGRAVLIEAIGRARRAGRVDLVARAALQVGGVLPAGEAPDPIAEELIGGALAGLGNDTPHLLAELTARLAQLRYWDSSLDDRLALCAEADRLCSGADGAAPSAPRRCPARRHQPLLGLRHRPGSRDRMGPHRPPQLVGRAVGRQASGAAGHQVPSLHVAGLGRRRGRRFTGGPVCRRGERAGQPRPGAARTPLWGVARRLTGRPDGGRRPCGQIVRTARLHRPGVPRRGGRPAGTPAVALAHLPTRGGVGVHRRGHGAGTGAANVATAACLVPRVGR
ncbi:MAG: BTAD domain-containing putative transcriptional regulator [Microthrixaceae bacterium]